jgi:hypothetical protein
MVVGRLKYNLYPPLSMFGHCGNIHYFFAQLKILVKGKTENYTIST